MAEVQIHVAGRNYRVACRDGEEAKLQDVAALVDARARSVTAALGPMGEARQLLFTALMLADGQVKSPGPADDEPLRAAVEEAVAGTLESLAERLEALADELEARAPTP